MRRLVPILTALLLAAPTSAQEPQLVPDISARNVEIRYSFTGAQLLLFGAIVYPDGRVPETTPDIAVVLRGPTEAILIREKKKIAGIWMNADSHRFASAPSFYAIASSRPMEELIDDRTAVIYELGIGDMQLSTGGGALPEKEQRFEDGLMDLRRRQGLYVESAHGVEISDGVLYRARIDIPSSVPVGDYDAETYLIVDGEVVAAASRDVHIGKAGFERTIALAARRRPLTYGLLSVFVSLFAGYAAAMFFRRRAGR